jgi:hypothetical protein
MLSALCGQSTLSVANMLCTASNIVKLTSKEHWLNGSGTENTKYLKRNMPPAPSSAKNPKRIGQGSNCGLRSHRMATNCLQHSTDRQVTGWRLTACSIAQTGRSQDGVGCGVWCGVVWCAVVWCGVLWCGVVWGGVLWCGVVWCGVLWCGVVYCGVVWCGVWWRAQSDKGLSVQDCSRFCVSGVELPSSASSALLASLLLSQNDGRGQSRAGARRQICPNMALNISKRGLQCNFCTGHVMQ